MIVAPDGATEPVETSKVQHYLARRSRWQAEEGKRIEEIKARGKVPDLCGPEIPEAPARRAFRVFEPQGLYPDGAEGWVNKPSGYHGRKTIEHSDAFDQMEGQARKLLFTPGQKQIGRLYATLTEKLASADIRCSTMEVRQGSCSSGGGYIEAVVRDRRQLDLLQRRIGQGVAMEVRKIRPSQRNQRRPIPDRALVDAVCLQGKTIAGVLERHGWKQPGKPAAGQHIKALRAALCATLDRMIGPVTSGMQVQSSEDIAKAMQSWVRGGG
ncbi:MAG: hypothetical protein FalmKO_32070 [Falsiruegeria mediterranea]